MRAKSVVGAASEGHQGGDCGACRDVENGLHLVGLEAQHRRGIEAFRLGDEEQITEGDVGLRIAPGLALVGALS